MVTADAVVLQYWIFSKWLHDWNDIKSKQNFAKFEFKLEFQGHILYISAPLLRPQMQK